MIKIGRVYINLLIIPLLFAAYITNSLSELYMAYITATLHELAHLLVALRYKVLISGFVIMPFGVCMRIKDNKIDNPVHECIICMAGPLANLALIIVGFLLRDYLAAPKELVDFFICSNASILLINTIPIVPLDGGRVLRAALTAKYGFLKASKLSHIISQLNIVLIGFFGIYVLWITRFNVSVMLLCTFLIFNMSAEKKNNELTLMRQLVYSKRKLSSREIMPVRELAVTKGISIRNLLKNFSYDKYYIVNVMNSKMEIERTLTETQIIAGISHTKKDSDLQNIFDKY